MADESAKEKFFNKEGTDWWVWWVSAGFIIVFIIAALINVDTVGAIVTAAFTWVCDYFGAFWQILLIATFFLGLGLAISKYGAIKLTDEKPDFTTLKWVAMIVTTLLAGGGVFFSANCKPRKPIGPMVPAATPITANASASFPHILSIAFSLRIG